VQRLKAGDKHGIQGANPLIAQPWLCAMSQNQVVFIHQDGIGLLPHQVAAASRQFLQYIGVIAHHQHPKRGAARGLDHRRRKIQAASAGFRKQDGRKVRLGSVQGLLKKSFA